MISVYWGTDGPYAVCERADEALELIRQIQFVVDCRKPGPIPPIEDVAANPMPAEATEGLIQPEPPEALDDDSPTDRWLKKLEAQIETEF